MQHWIGRVAGQDGDPWILTAVTSPALPANLSTLFLIPQVVLFPEVELPGMLPDATTCPIPLPPPHHHHQSSHLLCSLLSPLHIPLAFISPGAPNVLLRVRKPLKQDGHVACLALAKKGGELMKIGHYHLPELLLKQKHLRSILIWRECCTVFEKKPAYPKVLSFSVL